ncbi:hypothetical protein DPMN_189592 [Dreissena polymorpha]|uniref:Uncharacterized protein n=1 Tax=Dreissena polymorpha TaxID=45954 RepID=A0A9D4DVT1_DREPO|nr:hypothetical protein DPMN_189592 [Dreissena polymorpha]
MHTMFRCLWMCNACPYSGSSWNVTVISRMPWEKGLPLCTTTTLATTLRIGSSGSSTSFPAQHNSALTSIPALYKHSILTPNCATPWDVKTISYAVSLVSAHTVSSVAPSRRDSSTHAMNAAVLTDAIRTYAFIKNLPSALMTKHSTALDYIPFLMSAQMFIMQKSRVQSSVASASSLMETGRNGALGLRAVSRVRMARRSEHAPALIRPLATVALTVLDQMLTLHCAQNSFVQYMETGRPGPVGLVAQLPVMLDW